MRIAGGFCANTLVKIFPLALKMLKSWVCVPCSEFRFSVFTAPPCCPTWKQLESLFHQTCCSPSQK